MPSMMLNEKFGDIQPQTGMPFLSGGRKFPLIKLLKYLLQILLLLLCTLLLFERNKYIEQFLIN